MDVNILLPEKACINILKSTVSYFFAMEDLQFSGLSGSKGDAWTAQGKGRDRYESTDIQFMKKNILLNVQKMK
jgi:hypothetical protein